MDASIWNAEWFSQQLRARLADVTSADGKSASETLQGLLETAVQQAETIGAARPCACGPACPHCCVLNVAILLPEGARIADWLRQHLETTALADLRTVLARHRGWERWMDDEERIIRRATCPFLDVAGSCLIHPVRPLACRGVASLDRSSCIAAFDPIIGDQERCVPADLLLRAVYDRVFATLGEALCERGLDDRSIELGAGVLAFLEHSEFSALFCRGGILPHALWE